MLAEGDPVLARLGVVVRAPLLALITLMTAFSDAGRPVALAAGLLITAGSAAAVLPQRGSLGRGIRYAEAVVWATCVVATGTTDSPLLPYLLAPALVGGLNDGVRASLAVPGLASASLLLENALLDSGAAIAEYSLNAAQWVILAVTSGLIGGGFRSQQRANARDESTTAQEAAHRLLVQLRTVARRLPGTLSPAATAESLLFDLRNLLDIERGVVLVRSEGQRLVPIAFVGDRPLDWDLELSADSAISEAWTSQQPAVRGRQHTRSDGSWPPGSGLALPFTLGLRSFGILAVESSRPGAYTASLVQVAAERAAAVTLSLDTGLLFDEIRSVATVEERQRVSREIHDGIAQELVYIGYALDNAIADSAGRVAAVAMQDVRDEVTRVIRELRMSLFDLRSGVDPIAGLGAALSEHVRSVGAQSGLTVHLSLTEATLRLPPAAEAELLRIAQEAIANARKHSGGTSLWVTCAVDPPAATLVVEDDGQGIIEAATSTSFGLRIMRERIDRLRGGLLNVGPRLDGTGTRVEVQLCGGVKPATAVISTEWPEAAP
jgi:signal transduction histidine kinase